MVPVNPLPPADPAGIVLAADRNALYSWSCWPGRFAPYRARDTSPKFVALTFHRWNCLRKLLASRFQSCERLNVHCLRLFVHCMRWRPRAPLARPAEAGNQNPDNRDHNQQSTSECMRFARRISWPSQARIEVMGINSLKNYVLMWLGSLRAAGC